VTRRPRDVDDLRIEIQELFADLWQVPQHSGLRPRFRPRCDCYRTFDPPALHVVVELPGADAGAVRVTAAGDALMIRGRRARPNVPGARYRQMEIEYGEFERRLDLGEDVDIARATATYERGFLRIVLPLEERT
jgi:HSP20 family protein